MTSQINSLSVESSYNKYIENEFNYPRLSLYDVIRSILLIPL